MVGWLGSTVVAGLFVLGSGQTLVKPAPADCTLLINDFANQDAFTNRQNALGKLSTDEGRMLSMVFEKDYVTMTPKPADFWFTNLVDGSDCFDASNFEYLSLTLSAHKDADATIYIQQRPSDCVPSDSQRLTVDTVTLAERYTFAGNEKVTFDIPLTEFTNIAKNNINSIAISGLTGPIKIYDIKLKGGCSPGLKPMPKTPAPLPCTTVVADFSQEMGEGFLTKQGGKTSDDGTMVSMTVVNNAMALVASRSKHSYFFSTYGQCLDVSNFDYLHLQMTVPAEFMMQITIQSSSDCLNDNARTNKFPVHTKNYKNVFNTGVVSDVYIPLADFKLIDPRAITAVFLDDFELRTSRQSDYLLRFFINKIEFSRTGCPGVIPTVALPPSAAICGVQLNDFNEWQKATTVNLIGGSSGDGNSMSTIQASVDGRLQLSTKGVESYWFSRADGDCEPLGSSLVFLNMKVWAVKGFDMRVDMIVAADCNDPTKGLTTSSVRAADYVEFTTLGATNLYIPLADFSNYFGVFTAIQIGAFRNMETDIGNLQAAPMTIFIDDVGFREEACSTDIPPLPPLPCKLIVDNFDFGDRPLNMLMMPHGSDGNMDTLQYSGGKLNMTSKDGASYWFTNMPLCTSLKFWDGIYMNVQGPPGSDFMIRFKVSTNCAPGTLDMDVLASDIFGAGKLNGQPQDMWIPFSAIRGFDKQTMTVATIVIGTLMLPGQEPATATPMSLVIGNIEFRAIVCPTRGPRNLKVNTPDDQKYVQGGAGNGPQKNTPGAPGSVAAAQDASGSFVYTISWIASAIALLATVHFLV